MSILEYLDYHDWDKDQFPEDSLVHNHVTFLSDDIVFPSKLKYDVALLGVPDNNENKSFYAAAQVKNELYRLVSLSGSLNIIDLGNIKTGHTFNDTCFAIREVIGFLNSLNIVTVLVGGDFNYNLGGYLAFRKSGSPVNVVHIDSVIKRERIPALSAANFALVEDKEPDLLFNFINIGYQSYFTDKKSIDYLNDSFFEAYRVGLVRSNIKEMEPVIRDANILNFSLNAIKFSDAPGSNTPIPNGFTGEEACQLSFYAGHSNRMRCFGIFDFTPGKDQNGITSKLASQILWYFLEGISGSIYEEPDITPDNFKKFMIHLNHPDQDISFYRSNLTNRWWMEISYPGENRSLLLSCSENDYELACQQEIPDRWLRTFHRISR